MITTVGAKPACLVNASVTYVGNDQIYAFGGFDQYTDEVYNHVLRLNLASRQWNLVDNYGDIPGVRMGHTANLWQGDKLLVFGGENEHRQHLSDIIVFDLKTAYWTQPELHGASPRGRARHSAVIHDEKLYISGGQTGHDSVLDDICYLDLKTWTWSRSWKFVPRYDHASWVWNGRIWIFGGINDEMEKNTEIWWLDLRGSPGFEQAMAYGTADRQLVSRFQRDPRAIANPTPGQQAAGSTGYLANSSVQSYPSTLTAARSPYTAPGSISSLKFHSSPNLPSQAAGMHFHVFSSGCMLDFVTPAELSCETSLSSLELDTLRWQKLADGKDLFSPNFRWHYCTMNAEGTHAWLLGSSVEPSGDGNGMTGGEYLSDVLAIDLRKYGILGNELASDSRAKIPSSDANVGSYLTGIGADLSTTFDKAPETGSGADFIITAYPDDYDIESPVEQPSSSSDAVIPQSRPIHVHKLILHARWPHFARLWSAQMAEFHSKKMHIPEPYSAVRAFLFYLYSDSIAPNPQNGPSINDVAGMLVMANIYDMPRLRLLCVNRLGKELDIEHAAFIWERAGTAGEEWLRRRAAAFCLNNWGRIVRTRAFKNLQHTALLELCEEIDTEGRAVSGEELEMMGALSRPFGGSGSNRKRSLGSAGVVAVGDDDEGEELEDDGMDVN
ncbi:hypothetical protein BCR34DRAFT_479960 [Clohesyomyces aquaticus]|uniref:BTB domain-containing protein n=1 Tax=Clohesyomyces aquaticus TaxID=1231657 RepID=A0A1Y1ZVX1_9PLEO|nr:hypothetical protein BCR34DRAFT_479960 [Clohesyomyces aquaticus]